MKRNVSVVKLFCFFCSNLWYIPALLLLLYFKVTLISLLRSGGGNNGSVLSSSGGAVHESRLLDEISLVARRDRDQDFSRASLLQSKNNVRNKRGSVGGKKKKQIRNDNVTTRLTRTDLQMLEDLENAVIRPSAANRTEQDSVWVVLNQVFRGGGGILKNVLQRLQDENGFKHLEHDYRTPWNRFLLEEEQQNLVTWFQYQHLPRSYDRHFYFVNFTKFQKYVLGTPIYVNIIRDPVTRLRSAFRYKRENTHVSALEVQRRNEASLGSGDEWLKLDFETCVLTNNAECDYRNGYQDFTLSVPFFCGQFNSCVEIGSKWALQAAKFNIEKYYSVVGLYEAVDDSLLVLERYAPKFFTGATKLEPPIAVPAEDPVSDAVREVLQQKLPYEFDLYQFVSERLDQQLISIYNSRHQS